MKWIDQYDGGSHEANFHKLDCSKLKIHLAGIQDEMSRLRWKRSRSGQSGLAGEDIADYMERQIEEFVK